MPAHRFQSDQVASNANWAAGSTVDDFGSAGIKADVVDESTAGSGVTIDNALIQDGQLEAPCLSTSALTASGYKTGAGGAVTQITNASTGVTLSKPCGQITTVALTTAAGAEEQFTVANTKVAATDTIILSTTYAGGGTPILQAVAVGSASFDIVISNAHASAAFDAVMVINFAIIKSVAA